ATQKLARYRARAVQCDALLLAAILHPGRRVTKLEAEYRADVAALAKDLLWAELNKESGRTKPVATAAAATKPAETSKAPNQDGLAISSPVTGGLKMRETEMALGWWQDSQDHLPTLKKVARRVLATRNASSLARDVCSRSADVPFSPAVLQKLIIAQQLIKAAFEPVSVGLRLP
ncbi:hypothetical protein V8E36_001630, partial [Tilletia maclaganii]